MAVFRSYLAAQASLIRGSGTNNSRNPIIELSWGGATDSPSNTKVTRFLFRPDFSALRAEVAAGRLRREDVTTHQLFFKNVVTLVPEGLRSDRVEDAQRGSGVTVFLRQLPATEAFDEGSGYDYLYAPNREAQSGAPRQTPNWFYRRSNQLWATPGAWNPATAPTLGQCMVSEGTEDLVFDVTPYVQGVLFDNQPERPLLLQLDDQTEQTLTARRQVITFFSRFTHHWFEPYLETVSDPLLRENRCAVPLDEPSRIYLQVPPVLSAAIQVLSVEVFVDSPGTPTTIAPLSIPLARVVSPRPGVYYVPLLLDSGNVPDGAVCRDVWTLQQGNSVKEIEQAFVTVDRLLLSPADSQDRTYSLSLSGLKAQEVISRAAATGPRQVAVHVRAFANGQLQVADPCQGGGCPTVAYRLYCAQGKEQVEVIPLTLCYRLGERTFLELDARWLIPQFYVLEVQVLGEDGVGQGTPLSYRFRVVN